LEKPAAQAALPPITPKAAPGAALHRPRFINDRYALAPNPREGGMALVYRGNDMLDANRQIAVKVFRHDTIEQPVLAEVFKRETQALKELDHAGIVKLFDSGVDQETGQYFLVFEWMETDLAERLKSAPPEGWDDFASAVALPVL
jgi:serine/threonine protein kinase